MKCPKCGFENPEGMNFCGECAAKLEVICPSCNAPNPPQFKFCGKCAQDLRATRAAPPLDLTQPHSYTPKFLADKILTTRSSLEGERKVVTVLFADVANYTALSEKLDSEEVHEIMDGCFRILMDEIHRCEGTINQFTGDGVMALFGAPIAHEDHARRACHAALAIQRVLVEYALKIEKDTGHPFRMRIGLNSGPVVVGAIGNDLRMDYTAIGDTTNLAARMQSLATPGGILATHETHRLARDYFDFESLGKLKVKGKEEPQEAYVLLRAGEVETRIEASVARGLTRFVGRETETAVLRNAFDRAVSGSGQVVGIVGEAGVGKSRLLLELRTITPPGTNTYLEGRCLHYGGAMPYLPVLDLLRSYFAIKEGEREFMIRKNMKERVLALDENLGHVLAPCQDLLSLKVEDEAHLALEPQARREKTFEALRDLFVRISQEKPLVIAVEDLHWMDRTSLEFLDYLIGWLANTPILLVLLYRPEFAHTWNSRSYYTQIGVDQLTLQPSAELVQSILAGGEVAPEIRDLILKRTAGNPLFMEEFTQSLLENGAIEKKDHQYVLARRASEIQIPESIQGIIAARIDRLQENLKRTMQVASVIGRDFAFRILQTITGMREDLKSQLMNLQGLEFIYEKQLFPELEYIFKHILTQEVAYNSLLARRRSEIHEKIGRAIETIYAERIEEFYEMLAYHYGKGENFEKAAHYFRLSGGKAVAKFAHWEAFRFYREALNALKQLPESEENKKRQIEVILLMHFPMTSLGHPEGSLEILKEAERLALETGDERNLIFFYGRLSNFYSVRAEPSTALDYGEKAYQAARNAQDVELMGGMTVTLANAFISVGVWRKILDICTETIALFEQTNKQSDYCGRPYPIYPVICVFGGHALAVLGDFEKAEFLCKKAMEHATKEGNLFALAYAEFLYGYCYNIKGNGKHAIEHCEWCIEHVEQGGYDFILAPAWNYLGWAHYLLGELEKTDTLIGKSIEMSMQLGVESGRSDMYHPWSIVHFELGNEPKALDLSEEALRLAEKTGEKFQESNVRCFWGRIIGRIDPTRRAEGERSIRQGIEILRKLEQRPHYSYGYLWLGELYAEAGQREKALENLGIAEANFLDMGMDWWLARVYAAYAELWKREGDMAKAKESYRTAIEIFRECGAAGWVTRYEEEMARL
jgi:class 3 adenylate cyclase/tetratricopeptide (TPR) repeat protein